MPEQQASRGQDHAAPAKKPYVKPECVSEPIYETMALACGKLPGQSFQCNGAPKRS
ncbi:MAG: hypothetical protein WAN10_08810 [Candidatus Acidiferrales bacterium]